MRNGAVSSKSLVPRRSRMKEFCGDDVEVCQPSVGGLLAAGALFQWDLKYWRNYIVRKAFNCLNNHKPGQRVYTYAQIRLLVLSSDSYSRRRALVVNEKAHHCVQDVDQF